MQIICEIGLPILQVRVTIQDTVLEMFTFIKLSLVEIGCQGLEVGPGHAATPAKAGGLDGRGDFAQALPIIGDFPLIEDSRHHAATA